jgi:hypothetical protein
MMELTRVKNDPAGISCPQLDQHRIPKNQEYVDNQEIISAGRETNNLPESFSLPVCDELKLRENQADIPRKFLHISQSSQIPLSSPILRSSHPELIRLPITGLQPRNSQGVAG